MNSSCNMTTLLQPSEDCGKVSNTAVASACIVCNTPWLAVNCLIVGGFHLIAKPEREVIKEVCPNLHLA